MLFYFLSGAICLACFAASLFFLRFWKKSKDVLFLMFALAFALFGIERLVIAFVTTATEAKPYIYLIRLIAFCLIIAAIVVKNKPKSR